MTPISAFAEWVEGRAPGFTLTRGAWREDSADGEKRFLSMWASPGRAPSGDTGYAVLRVVMTGRRQQPGDAVMVEQAIQNIATQADEDYRTDCIGYIRVMGFPAGPFFSEENRVYYELNLELLMRY